MLNVLDEFTHECLAIRVARKLKAIDVIDLAKNRPNAGTFDIPIQEQFLDDRSVRSVFESKAAQWRAERRSVRNGTKKMPRLG